MLKEAREVLELALFNAAESGLTKEEALRIVDAGKLWNEVKEKL